MSLVNQARTALVIAKEPRPGRVKTRLTPPLTPEQAAAVAAAAIRDTVAAVERAKLSRRVLVFDGDPTGWCPPSWRVARQPSGGLDARLVAAFGHSRGPAVLVGMDTPQLSPDDLEAFDPERYDACLGPARDGGYWLIGLADPRRARAAISGVPMSTDTTGAEQLHRLEALGLRVQLLEERTDVDTIDSALEVAAAAPATGFARALAGLTAVV